MVYYSRKVYKELERILKLSNIDISVDKVLSIAKTITTIKINRPNIVTGKYLDKNNASNTKAQIYRKII